MGLLKGLRRLFKRGGMVEETQDDAPELVAVGDMVGFHRDYDEVIAFVVTPDTTDNGRTQVRFFDWFTSEWNTMWAANERLSFEWATGAQS